MKINKTALSLATTCLTAALTAIDTHAAVITSFDFTGGTLNSTGGSSSSTIGFEAGITGSDTSSGDLRIQGLQTAGGALGGSAYTSHDEDRIASENWITFSITVSDTQEIDLTSLNFDYTEIEPASFLLGVYTSKTGFTEGDHLLGLYRNGIPGGTFTTNNGTSVDLSGVTALQDLTDETVEFRFLLGDDSGATSRIHVLDNIVLNGDVTVVPEPSATALLGLGGLALVLRRRRA